MYLHIIELSCVKKIIKTENLFMVITYWHNVLILKEQETNKISTISNQNLISGKVPKHIM